MDLILWLLRMILAKIGLRLRTREYTKIFELAVVDRKLLGNTYEKGVFTFNEATNRWETARDGIDNSVVRDLVAVNTGKLWAISTGSINAYDLADGKWLDIADLPIPEHYYSILEVSKSGKIAVAESYSQHFYLKQRPRYFLGHHLSISCRLCRSHRVDFVA